MAYRFTDTNKKEVRFSVFNKYNGHCAYCGCVIKYDDFTIDHIVPKFRGSTKTELSKYGRIKGECSIDNYNPSCKSCNSSKSTFTIEQWRSEINQKFDRLMKYNSSFRLINRFNLIKKQNEVIFYFEKHNKC